MEPFQSSDRFADGQPDRRRFAHGVQAYQWRQA